jgi:hypothetical protein
VLLRDEEQFQWQRSSEDSVVVLEERNVVGGVVLAQNTWLYIGQRGVEMAGILGGREWVRELRRENMAGKKGRERTGRREWAREKQRESFGGDWA